MVFIQHQSEELTIQLKNELEKKYVKDATFHCNKGAINVSSVQVSKETEVKVLSKRLNCEVYTIGEGYNDLPRIAAFQGFSVSNAPEEVKQKAVKVFDCIQDCIDYLSMK